MITFFISDHFGWMWNVIKNISIRLNALWVHEIQFGLAMDCCVCSVHVCNKSFRRFFVQLFWFLAYVCKRVLWHLVGAAEWNENIQWRDICDKLSFRNAHFVRSILNTHSCNSSSISFFRYLDFEKKSFVAKKKRCRKWVSNLASHQLTDTTVDRHRDRRSHWITMEILV